MTDWQKLCIERWRTVSSNFVLCFGKHELSPKDCIEHIKLNDEIGQNLIKVDKEYFKTIKEGKLFRE